MCEKIKYRPTKVRATAVTFSGLKNSLGRTTNKNAAAASGAAFGQDIWEAVF
jgi:hypothetical protein